jgi:lipopolysaccharide transport system ATP-binding protein
MSSDQGSAVQTLGRYEGTSKDNIAIRVSDLSKHYEIYNSPRDRLKQYVLPHLYRLFGQLPMRYCREFCALENVSFEVRQGETVGIIGRNGSGKSTLLQIICGTLSPSSGSVQIQGRVAALLELGAGFNTEFTGRENAYLNAALLGLSQAQIDEKFSAISAFADIGEFMNQPVKTYSSGMYVRLAFAVAVTVEPDILIVDEALAVGDMAFQSKCMGHIRRMTESGTTILFVSHDIGAVKALCSRCLYLDRGKIVTYGRAADVAALYIARSHLDINAALDPLSLPNVERGIPFGEASPLTAGAVSEAGQFAVKTDVEVDLGPEATRYGDGRVTVLDIKLLGQAGVPVDQLELDERFQIQISVRINSDLSDLAWGYSMRDLKGQMLIAMMSTSDLSVDPRPVKAEDKIVLSIKGKNPLQAGIYTLAVGIELPVLPNQQHIFLEVVENALVFRSVWPSDISRLFPGLVKVPVEFDVIAAMSAGETKRVRP